MASYNTVITNEGAALLASVIANQGTLTLSEMRFSTTDYDGVEATLTVGTFAGVFITAAASGSVVDATTIKVGSQFDNSGIVGDHPLYSIGIVGTDGNTTALIAVCTTTNPDIIRAALTGVSTYAFNVNLAVSSTLNIHVYGTTAAVIYDTDVIDNLTSPATNKPLSANQGRVLNENIEAIVDVYGAKNQSNQTFTSQTIDVVSHTPNADRSLTVTTNGASTTTVVASVISTSFTVEKGTYLFTFEKDSDEPTTSPYSIIVRDSSNTYVCGSTQTKAQRTITFAQDTTIHYECYCGANNVVSDVTFYPMIRDDRITDPTYEPYAKTNQQLTADKAERADLATLNLTGSTNTTGSTINAGVYFYLNGSYCKAISNITNGATFTLNTNFEVASVGNELSSLYPSYIGDCLGSDATLNSLIQNYCSSLPLGLHLANIEDNYGTSVLSGGSKVLLILKGSNSYYAIMAYGYDATSANAPIFKGCFHAGIFKGFVKISPVSP